MQTLSFEPNLNILGEYVMMRRQFDEMHILFISSSNQQLISLA